MVELIIDNRERDLINILNKFNAEFKIEMLEIGDIVFRENNNISLVIERKTINDLKASICDGRNREQKARLMNCGIDRSRIMYLIEGVLDKPLENKISGVSVSTLLGSLINTQLRDNIKVYKTVSISETARFIIRMYQKLTADMGEYFTKNELTISDEIYAATLKTRKKDNVTPSIWFIQQLASVPQVTEKIASVIVLKYGSVKNLILGYESLSEDERSKMLADLTYPIANEKVRRIGIKISAKIYNLFYGIC
jgi:ERCC4-type nuclease